MAATGQRWTRTCFAPEIQKLGTALEAQRYGALIMFAKQSSHAGRQIDPLEPRSDAMLRLTKALNRLFGYRWSIQFCEGEKAVKYTLHGDSAMQLLFHVGHMWQEKELRDPWQIFITYNKKRKTRQLHHHDFTGENASVSGDLAGWIALNDPGSIARYGHLAFFKIGSGRELPLGPRHTFALGSRDDVERSDLMKSVAGAAEAKPATVRSLDDLEDLIFQKAV